MRRLRVMWWCGDGWRYVVKVAGVAERTLAGEARLVAHGPRLRPRMRGLDWGFVNSETHTSLLCCCLPTCTLIIYLFLHIAVLINRESLAYCLCLNV